MLNRINLMFGFNKKIKTTIYNSFIKTMGVEEKILATSKETSFSPEERILFMKSALLLYTKVLKNCVLCFVIMVI